MRATIVPLFILTKTTQRNEKNYNPVIHYGIPNQLQCKQYKQERRFTLGKPFTSLLFASSEILCRDCGHSFITNKKKK